MTSQELIYIGLFSVLLLNKHTRKASCVFILAYALQLTLTYLLPASMYFSISGTAHLLIFLSLVNLKSRTYFLVSLLSVCLIFVNIQGYINYEQYLPPDEYNNAYFILLTAQLILLYLRAGINGLIDRFNFKRNLVQLIIDSNLEAFDSYLYSKNKETDK